MNVLTLCGSAKINSQNQKLLDLIETSLPKYRFSHCDFLSKLPLFIDSDNREKSDLVEKFKLEISESDLIIISTPEYTFNIPALLKNAFEWITASGELYQKKLIAIVFTPNAPRGERAMQSLLFSLTALDANVLTSCQLYQNEIFDADASCKEDFIEMLSSIFAEVA